MHWSSCCLEEKGSQSGKKWVVYDKDNNDNKCFVMIYIIKWNESIFPHSSNSLANSVISKDIKVILRKKSFLFMSFFNKVGFFGCTEWNVFRVPVIISRLCVFDTTSRLWAGYFQFFYITMSCLCGSVEWSFFLRRSWWSWRVNLSVCVFQKHVKVFCLVGESIFWTIYFFAFLHWAWNEWYVVRRVPKVKKEWKTY